MNDVSTSTIAGALGMHDIGRRGVPDAPACGSSGREAEAKILQLIRARLHQSVYIAIRGVQADYIDGTLYFRGVMPTFYTKQVLLSLAEDLADLGVEKVVDETTVMKH